MSLRTFLAAFDHGCATGDVERPARRALRKCEGADCDALVAPPRKRCAPCSDVLRQQQRNETRRRKRERELRSE